MSSRIKVVALVLALLVFMLTYLFLNSLKPSTDSSGDSGAVYKKQMMVHARQDIAPNTVLTAEMLELKEADLQEGELDYFERVEDAVGRVASSDIFSGERITRRRTTEKDEHYSLASKIEKGMRAVTISVDQAAGLSWNLRVGDRVDVNYALEFEDDLNEVGVVSILSAGVRFDAILGEQSPANTSVFHNQVGRQFVYTPFQNVKVLALDHLAHYIHNNDGLQYTTVTLELSPMQVRHLLLMETRNAIPYLSLRTSGDDEMLNPPRDEMLKPFGAALTNGNADAAYGEIAGSDNASANTQENTTEASGTDNTGSGRTTSTPAVQ